MMATAVGACLDPSFTASVFGRRPFPAPATYQTWWASTERCSGLRGSFGRVSWYLADGIQGDGAVAKARWSPPHDIIIVAGYEGDDFIVRHEMLHDLLGGDPAHDNERWDMCSLRR